MVSDASPAPGARSLTPLLPVDLEFATYAARYARGATPDRYPYGLETLPEGWVLADSAPRFRSGFAELARRAVRRATGADVVGALHRWRAVRSADVIYSHAEAEYLGAAILLRLTRTRRPILVGQTIWLFAHWDELPPWRRALLRWAMSRVDLFVYNAEPNLAIGRRIMPRGNHHYVRFGVSRMFRNAAPWRGRAEATPLVLSVGNDSSRDWEVLAQALAALDVPAEVRLATPATPSGFEQATVCTTADLAELCELYRTASCLVVAVQPNAHASGITTILEGAAIGVPMVVTDAGGLGAYVDATEVRYVPPGDPAALSAAIAEVLADPEAAGAMGRRARARFERDTSTNDAYWARVLACVLDNVRPRHG